MLAHFGVSVRAPLRGAPVDEELLTSVLRRTLPPQAVAHALGAPPPAGDLAAQVVRALHEEVEAALVPPRPWSDTTASVTMLRRLMAGDDLDAGALLRAFLVERWLAGLGAPVSVPETPAEVRPIAVLPGVPLPQPEDVVIGADSWTRIAVRTAPIAAGDQLLANTAFYVANALAGREAPPTGPWFAVLSGKVVAVSQRRVNPTSEVRSRRIARLLAWLVRRRWPRLALPAAMQVAIDQSGVWRLLGALVFGGPVPAQCRVYPPRRGAMAPADAAVVQPPYQPEEVAASLTAAMRLALAPEYGTLLAGVAVVSADETGCRVLGFAPGPAVGLTPRPRTLLSQLLDDNPAGQGAQRTPIVVVAQHSPVAAQPRPPVDREPDLATH
jgi:asparagine synthase (glutamine-hydrolysing)